MAQLAMLLRYAWEDVSSGRMPSSNLMERIVSLGLGYALVLGASGLKLPQIFSILRSESAKGIRKESSEIEVLAYSITCAYAWQKNLPFSAYGESVFLALQSMVLCGLIYKYQRVNWTRRSFAVGSFAAAAAATITGRLDKEWIETLFDAVVVLVLAARLPQIISNYKNKSTGQLSLITVGLTFLGGLVRIFTSVKENAGRGMIQSYMLASVLNFILTAQILYYGKERKKSTASKKRKGKQKAR